MASMAVTTICSKLRFRRNQSLHPQACESSVSLSGFTHHVVVQDAWDDSSRGLLFSCRRDVRHMSWPISAVGSGSKELSFTCPREDRVTKFVIQEIENLTVKSQFKTIQTAEELESAFTPGSEFGFNATMEIVKSDPETTDSDSS